MERADQKYPDIFKGSILGFGNSIVFVTESPRYSTDFDQIYCPRGIELYFKANIG
jgi:hypothetical protein